MNLEEFLKLYNFRVYHNDKENTQIVRIYTDFPIDWFEFGVNDWGYQETTPERIKMFIHPDILKQDVTSVNYDDDNSVFCIHIAEKKTNEAA